MRRRMIVAMLLLSVPSALLAAAYHLDQSRPTEAPTPVTLEEPEPSDMHVRTGDQFWGINLDGVIPCSKMLVRGGGHLVILSPGDRPDAKCYFHVRSPKKVDLQGTRFTLAVAGQDKIHVTRADDEQLASN